jgi:5-methylcytosine-specific restriction endonuclease McrA
VSDVLVLNADAQPVSYLPLSAIQWKEAITYMWLDKVEVLEWYDDWIVRSASWETKVPSVIMLKDFMRRRRRPRFSKTNLYIRDLYTCQYCANEFSRNNLTLDHVRPLSLGGKTSWDNIVAACQKCNTAKGNKMLMKPKKQPYEPDYYELVNKRKQLEFQLRHPTWANYIYV